VKEPEVKGQEKSNEGFNKNLFSEFSFPQELNKMEGDKTKLNNVECAHTTYQYGSLATI
jgi:hypothetical protein